MVRQGSDEPDISERLNGTHAASDYDALADLFLGDPATYEAGHKPATAHPPVVIDAASVELGSAHGPCCSRVGPIGGAATTKPTARSVDVLVLGHLPGIGGAWAAQHARTAAAKVHAPACLLRLSGGHLVVELIWPDDARPPTFTACADSHAALRLAAERVGAWLLRVHGSDEALLNGWFSNPSTANSADASVDRVRLMTGADDTAIVAAYGRLKAWHAASPHGFARLARVTIVEPDATRAAAAEDRLRRAAASFLETRLAPAERLGAMRPMRTTTLYSGPFESDAGVLLSLVRAVSARVPQKPQVGMNALGNGTNAVGAVEGRGTAIGSARDATANGGHATADGSPESSDGMNVGAAPEVRWQGSASVGTGIIPPGNLRQSAAAFGASARISIGGSAGPSPVDVGPSVDQIIAMLARSASVDTLRAAPTACPWAPGIVLAVDHHGESHAIAFAGDASRVSPAAVDLLTASRWCAEHASLLALAGITPRARDTTLHLLTTTPAAALRLAETGLRVHAAVRVGEGWGAVALS